MPLRLLYGISILLVLHSISFAQEKGELSLSIGPELAERKGDRLLFTFGHSDTSFYNLWSDRRRNGSFILDEISIDSLHVQSTNPFSFSQVKNLVPTLSYPLSMKGHSYLVATAEDPKGEEVYIFAYKILSDSKLAPEPIVLGRGNREAILSENGFLLLKSPNAKLVALLIPKEKAYEKNEKFTLSYFNRNLNQLSSKEIEIPYSSGRVSLKEALVTDGGVIHGVISVRSENEVRITPSTHALLSYDPEKDVVREKALSLGNKWFYDISLTLTPDTNLWLAGYYSNMVELSMAGTFSVLVDSKSGDLLNTGLSPFEREFRLKFRSDIKRREDELGLFKLDETHLPKKNELTLVSEKRYSRTSTIFNPATGTYSVVEVYNYDEVLLTTLQPTSKILYNVLIPKYQSYSASQGRFTSYLTAADSSKLYVFYNDHIRNIDLNASEFTEYRQLNNENNMAITYCVYDGESITRKSILPDRVSEYYLDPDNFYRYKNQIILTAYNGYRIRFIRADLN